MPQPARVSASSNCLPDYRSRWNCTDVPSTAWTSCFTIPTVSVGRTSNVQVLPEMVCKKLWMLPDDEDPESAKRLFQSRVEVRHALELGEQRRVEGGLL